MYILEHKTKRKISHGRCNPLGATLTDGGVNFALFSKYAREVFLLLFDHDDGQPTDIIKLEQCTKHIWHTYIHGIKAGQLYAYKVRGVFDPARGLRFNEHKLLIDPYAKALSGKLVNHDNLLLAYDPLDPRKDLVMDERDNTAIVPKSIVISDDFNWQGDVHPDIPLEKLFIYEVHAKGFTAHPSSHVAHAGTYLGFVEKIPYLKNLGVNAVELLPVHEFYVEDMLHNKGLANYWGYNTVSFFAPELSYSTMRTPGCQVTEMKTLVRELHKAGIEVILDVVFNHSGEGNELGPTFCLKGIDNPTYYSLTGSPSEPARYYMNYTGCGNSVNTNNSPVIRMIMDSLRYWVQTMHVDGFRFDLASVLGRDGGDFCSSASFFDAVSQDPVLNCIKLIAEPWDLGSYQVGNFPVDWSEWNGHFRDTMRRFARGESGLAPEVGRRLTGSADLYGDDGRSAYNSINFITCHDGFTLWDLVSYNYKHNQANLEDNRDGADDNNSWNCGIEGETSDLAVIRLRRRLAKNHLCHLLFSLGTPMILGGDEFLRTQKGNNNAYCQDNDIAWFDWSQLEAEEEMRTFVGKAIEFNKRHTILRRRKFFDGKDGGCNGIADIVWYGWNLQAPAWGDPNLRTLCYQLDGAEEECEIGDYRLFFILNASPSSQFVQLPKNLDGKSWYRAVDTSLPMGEDFMDPGDEVLLDPADGYWATARSTVVLVAR